MQRRIYATARISKQNFCRFLIKANPHALANFGLAFLFCAPKEGRKAAANMNGVKKQGARSSIRS
jgi:hypothetical protein